MADEYESFEQQQIRLLDEAERRRREAAFVRRMAKMDDYLYDKKQNAFWDTVVGEMYTAEAVDASIPRGEWPTKTVAGKNDSKRVVAVSPAKEIKNVENGLMVDSSTWWPGVDKLIQGVVATARGPMEVAGGLSYNTYFPPPEPGDARGTTVDKWLQHVRTLFPDEVEHGHFLDYAAHMLQHPEEKPNHGIVISGAQGIGKDTMLLPLRHGVGLWNTSEIGPDHLEESFNPHVQSVMLVVNEVRPYNEHHRASSFYNRIKPLLASPPEMLPMNIKNCNMMYVKNVLRAFMTTNDYLTMYVPEEDRRLFIMHSGMPPQWADNQYFADMFRYFEAGGKAAVIRFLLERDISHFRAGAPPPMTEGKRQIIGATQLVRRSIINEAFDAMVGEGEPPDVFFGFNLRSAFNGFDDIDKLDGALRAANLIHKMQEIGYDIVLNPSGRRWKWKRSKDGVVADVTCHQAFVRRQITGAARLEAIDEAGRAAATAQLAAKLGGPQRAF